jgi:hypothetical protein
MRLHTVPRSVAARCVLAGRQLLLLDKGRLSTLMLELGQASCLTKPFSVALAACNRAAAAVHTASASESSI